MIPDFPTTRSEAYLAKICGEDAELPEPQTRTDLFLAALAGADVVTPEPRTRSEIFLASILGQGVELPAPQSRLEIFLAKVAGLDVETPEPQTRLEMYLDEWAQGGGEPTYETVTGAIATFTTLRAALLQSLIVNIDPVQSGSGDPSPDNVRPISGHTGVNVWRTGKNLFHGTLINGITGSNGGYSDNAARVTNFLPNISGNSVMFINPGTYTLSVQGLDFCTVLTKDGDGNIIENFATAWHGLPFTFTLTKAGYLLFSGRTFAQGNIDPADYSPQIELSTTASSYEPFTGTTLTIDLDGTIYGGTLDVTTGVLTVTMANIASYAGESINEPWLSSMDKYVSGNTPTTGAQVVYTLATSVTYQLTPEEVINTLQGANVIWADAGNVSVTYRSN